MDDFRKIYLSVFYHIKDKLRTEGWSSSLIIMKEAFDKDIDPLPLVTVNISNAGIIALEMGGRGIPNLMLEIDIYALSSGSLLEIAEIIKEAINEEKAILWDFNYGFPTDDGNYAGIPELGIVNLSNLLMYKLSDPISPIIGERNHSYITCLVSTLNL